MLEQITFSQVVFKLFNLKCRTANRGVLNRSERLCMVWVPKLGLDKKNLQLMFCCYSLLSYKL